MSDRADLQKRMCRAADSVLSQLWSRWTSDISAEDRVHHFGASAGENYLWLKPALADDPIRHARRCLARYVKVVLRDRLGDSATEALYA
jgi:hypothetical protein